MRHLTLALAVLFSIPFAVKAQDRSSATKAWAVLETAYKNKDVETIIAGYDFAAEALQTFKMLGDDFDKAPAAQKAAMIEMMVNEKIANLRAGKRDLSGFPLHEKTSCVTMPEQVTDKGHAELELKCTTDKGVLMQPKLYFLQKNGQWLMFDILWK